MYLRKDPSNHDNCMATYLRINNDVWNFGEDTLLKLEMYVYVGQPYFNKLPQKCGVEISSMATFKWSKVKVKISRKPQYWHGHIDTCVVATFATFV